MRFPCFCSAACARPSCLACVVFPQQTPQHAGMQQQRDRHQIVSTSRRPQRLQSLETATHSIISYNPTGGAAFECVCDFLALSRLPSSMQHNCLACGAFPEQQSTLKQSSHPPPTPPRCHSPPRNPKRQAPCHALEAASHIVTSIPPAGLPLYDPVTRDQLRAVRRRARAARAGDAPPLRWLGVLSSTSVYGDHGGGWVDET